ncbi:MAG: hypothetical protein Q4Q22_03030 [Methanosphaera sp.]|nr:hypothetical protein [Methanosphaera sp.]
MITSKNMVILLVFTLMLTFGLQALSAAHVDSNGDFSTGEKSYASCENLSITSQVSNENANSSMATYIQASDEVSKTSVAKTNGDSVDVGTRRAGITGCADSKTMSYGYAHQKSEMKDDFWPNSDINLKTQMSESKNIKKLPNEKESISIEVDDLTCRVNDVVSINVQFNSSDVADGVLIFYVDDDVVATHNLSHSDNTLEFDTYGLEAGIHGVYVEYTASLIYESTDTSASLEITRHPTYITNFTTNFTDDNDINMTFDLLSDEQYVSDATLGLYHNGQLIKSVNLNDSTNSITIAGSYNREIIKITYGGDEYYESLELYQLINVAKRHLTLYVPSVTAYHSSQSDVTLTINNESRIVDGRIELYVDNLLVYTENATSDISSIPLNLTNYLEGTYELRALYTDSDVFEDASYTTTLKVNRIKTVIYANNITTYRNASLNLKASVYNYVDDTDEGLIEFFLDDETVQTGQITNNTVSYGYVIPDTLSYGNHSLKIVYYGSDKYTESEINTTLTINKYKTTLYVKNTTIDDDGLININLNLYSYNNAVDDGMVDCYVDGVLASSANVSNNSAKVRLPVEYVPGVEYDVELRYTNSDYFDDSTLNTRIQQNKTNTTISISKYLSNKNMLNITTYVFARDYSNISEGNVKIYLNNTLIYTCAVQNNTVNTFYDMGEFPSGNYTVYAEYLGSKRYAPSDNTTTIEKIVTPKTIYINAQSTIRTTPNETVTLKANLTDYESNLITDTINVKLIYNNQTISTNFTNGLLEVNITSCESTGKYIVELITENTTKYKAAKRNVTLNVNRNSTYIVAPNSITSLKLEDVLLNLTLNDNNGLIQTRTPVQIKIDNKTIYQGFINNGTLQYRLKLNSSYTQTQYNMTVIAGQTMTYSSTGKNITLKLQNRKAYIKSENIYSKKGDQLIFKAQLYDSLTHKMLTKSIPVAIKLNNLTIITTNTTNGQILSTYPNEYNNENYSITIKSATTGLYESSQWNGTLINQRSTIKVLAKNIYANANSTITIKATIYKEDKLTTDRIPVAIKINNLTIATMNVTDSMIEYQYKLPENLSQKEYNITIVTADTQNVIQSTTNLKLFVAKNYQQINVGNITAHKNDVISIKANITDKNGNIIKSNKLVNIKIAGTTIANINATDGIIDYNYTLGNLKEGYYDLIIKTGETNCYLHATSQSILNVRN